MMRTISALLFSLGLAALIPAPLAAETMAEMFPAYVDWLEPGYQEPFGKLQIQRGKVEVPGGVYELNLGEDYYALTGADAAWVMGPLWQNLPDPAIGALIFQQGTTPIDDSWAVAVGYYPDGHISDEEADQMDYGAIIQTRKDNDPEANRQRREAGLPELTTVGLAGTPGYDKATRALHFSVLLNYPADGTQVLNANIWVLARHGFVLMNVLGRPDHAPDVDAAMPELISLVALKDGNRYEDFIPGVDMVAAGGLSALLGGGATQAGLLVLLLAFLKKGGFVLLALPFIWLKKLFTGKPPTV
jgi:uncharacterized membrane-anchored protein